MSVRRIVANLQTGDPAELSSFYQELFDLDTAMDHGWIVTLAADSEMRTQLSLASEGGSGTAVPALSIEVDDVDDILAKARRMDIAVEYGPADEPWGVRRFYIRDPAGTLLNILSHTP